MTTFLCEYSNNFFKLKANRQLITEDQLVARQQLASALKRKYGKTEEQGVSLSKARQLVEET